MCNITKADGGGPIYIVHAQVGAFPAPGCYSAACIEVATPDAKLAEQDG